MARILIVTYGSLGDLHPALALARELQRRDHEVAFATGEFYRDKIAALGVPFVAVRPDFSFADSAMIRRVMDGAQGTRHLLRDLVYPRVREMHADLLPLARNADLLVGSELACAVPILGEQLGLRWAFLALSPVSLPTLRDPSRLPGMRVAHRLRGLRPLVYRFIYAAAAGVTHGWARPIRELRRELGLGPGRSPLFRGKFSPHLNLAAFTRVLQAPQPDWPARTTQTGTLFFDTPARETELPAELGAFLAAGAPPIVFTLGSAAVHLADDFYRVSAEAAAALGARAVLLHGKTPPPANLPPSIAACEYAPYATLLAHAAAVVHQGGVGTTSETLRAGKPMLVVPFAHDQFDNATRVVSAGAGRTLARHRYRAPRVARELGELIGCPRYALAAREAARTMSEERGAETAASALERLLA